MGVFCRRFGMCHLIVLNEYNNDNKMLVYLCFMRLFLKGVPLLDGGTVRLPHLIGLSRAMDLILTGREVGTEEALQMGW